MFLHIVDAKYAGDYKVEVSFNNGRKGIADLSDALQGTLFEPLKNKSYFAQLKINNELATITWPNGTDLAPEYVFFKAFQNESELQEQFKEWGYIG